jgi:hypothetical protein
MVVSHLLQRAERVASSLETLSDFIQNLSSTSLELRRVEVQYADVGLDAWAWLDRLDDACLCVSQIVARIRSLSVDGMEEELGVAAAGVAVRNAGRWCSGFG